MHTAFRAVLCAVQHFVVWQIGKSSHFGASARSHCATVNQKQQRSRRWQERNTATSAYQCQMYCQLFRCKSFRMRNFVLYVTDNPSEWTDDVLNSHPLSFLRCPFIFSNLPNRCWLDTIMITSQGPKIDLWRELLFRFDHQATAGGEDGRMYGHNVRLCLSSSRWSGYL